jgi:hypothetical protein
MCLTWLDGSRAWVLRKSLFYEFTTSACNSPLLKPFYGGLQGRFPCFAPMRLPFASKIVEHSRYLPLTRLLGKLGEYSDKSDPRIGFWAQDLDKKNFLRLGSLRERKFQGNEWKSLLHLFY